MATKKPAAKKCACAKGACNKAKAASKPVEKQAPMPDVEIVAAEFPEGFGGPAYVTLGPPAPKVADGNVLNHNLNDCTWAKSTECVFGGGRVTNAVDAGPMEYNPDHRYTHHGDGNPPLKFGEPDPAPAAASPAAESAPDSEKDPFDDPDAYIKHGVGLDAAETSEPFYEKARRLSREARCRASETESAIKRLIDSQIQSAAEIELKLNESNLRISQAIYNLTLILPAGTPKGDKARLAAVQFAILAQDDDWAEELYDEFAVQPMVLKAKAELELLKRQIDTMGVNYRLYWQTEEFVKP